jgi:tetratricopeptide (TPR) repeat protein
MRAFVFTDGSLAEQAGRFVWLAIDTEKSKNAALKKKFPIEALPTFFIVDPASEKVVLRWVGGATVGQLQRILNDGTLATSATGHAADRGLVRADLLYGEGKNAEAAMAYEEALVAAPDAWPRYGRAVESALFAMQRADRCEQAAKLARDAFTRLARSSSAANVAGSGLDCALSLPAEHAARKELVTALESTARAVVADSAIPLAADDRSGLYGILIDARKDAKDDAGAKMVASEWARFLEGEARAGTPDGRAVFDSHRLSAYLELGEPERAIAMLEVSERDLPQDYNPPARLAVALKALKRWDEALAASDRALAKAYGPRTLGILQTRAEIHTGRGDGAEARRTLEKALSLAEAMPSGQRSEATIASLKKKLEASK